VHITTWNFLPFLLRRVGASPRWVVNVTFAVWGAAIVALASTLWRFKMAIRQDAGPAYDVSVVPTQRIGTR
jgi:hypothetical protein